MTGFGVDPAALEGAIKKLEDIRDSTRTMLRSAGRLEPGELVAGDAYTNKARQEIQNRATGDQGSLRLTADELVGKLEEKIDAYKATLQEYKAAEDNATVDARRVDQQA